MDRWRRLHRKSAAWLASLAMLAAALMPAVTHALAVSGVARLTEVCTAQGMRWVADTSAAGEESTPATAAPADHCPYCTLSHGPALPPAAAPHVTPLQRAADVPPLFLHAPRTLFAWRTAQPRGPPSHA